MTRIDAASQLSAIVRAQLESTGRVRAASPARQRESKEVQNSPGSEQPMLRQIRAIPADDPERRSKALRIFMEAVLTKEFGARLQVDPGFPHLLDQVIGQMQDDPGLKSACSVAVDSLLQQAT
ncbi:hypothetical protein AVME950_07180 [Acidovorax sp. SUPP950]|uniref:hypothetical protein n=1 Tax=Acidovorax sp. SUPP950 TaxID=511901 RepID=UPI0023C374BE|nr:hypothetical protein [Acidovorax sp. SUPP950]GKS74654.1 hypothetical protein AVME950_07180 [Acidovorax sp. SUPP950]